MSRTQIVVYGGIAVTLLLLGVRWIQSSEEAVGARPGVGGVAVASGSAEGGGGRGGAIVVHVAGAAKDPGVYRLPDGSRVADAVERAGGPTGAALLDGINLAARLADGQQVVVPAKAKGATATAGAAAADAPISLGMATAEQLETIEGIGPVTAGKIVEYRDQRGGIASIEELEEIHGIGPATIERLRERLQP